MHEIIRAPVPPRVGASKAQRPLRQTINITLVQCVKLSNTPKINIVPISNIFIPPIRASAHCIKRSSNLSSSACFAIRTHPIQHPCKSFLMITPMENEKKKEERKTPLARCTWFSFCCIAFFLCRARTCACLSKVITHWRVVLARKCSQNRGAFFVSLVHLLLLVEADLARAHVDE